MLKPPVSRTWLHSQESCRAPTIPGHEWELYIRAAIRQVLTCDAVVSLPDLPDWHQSSGANFDRTRHTYQHSLSLSKRRDSPDMDCYKEMLGPERKLGMISIWTLNDQHHFKTLLHNGIWLRRQKIINRTNQRGDFRNCIYESGVDKRKVQSIYSALHAGLLVFNVF